MSIPIQDAMSGRGEIADRSPVEIADPLAALPLFLWKSQIVQRFQLTAYQFSEMFTPDVVAEMGIPPDEWRKRRRIWRKELYPLCQRYGISAAELCEAAAIR